MSLSDESFEEILFGTIDREYDIYGEDLYKAQECEFELMKKRRSIKYNHLRLDWSEHKDAMIGDGTFYCKMHMDVAAFDNLVEWLREDLTVNELQSRQSSSGGGPIYPEMIVATGLRWLGGEKLKSLHEIYNYSTGSGGCIVENFIFAVLQCNRLRIKLPTTIGELRVVANGFLRVSQVGGHFYGVVGAIARFKHCIFRE